MPRSGLDIDALLKQPEHKRAKIDPNNAIPEFRQIFNTSDDEDVVKDAAKQMGQIIRDLISDSMGDLNYERVIEDLSVLREGMVDFEFAALFNTFLLDLKKKILSGELGGDRRELWWMLKGKGLGLIDNVTVESSNVTPEEAAEVSTNYVALDILAPADLLYNSTRSSVSSRNHWLHSEGNRAGSIGSAGSISS